MLKRLSVAAIIFGAMVVFVPNLADPYNLPKFAPVLMATFALLIMRSNRRSWIEPPIWIMLGAASISWAFSWDYSYSLIGTNTQSYDSMMAFACYALVFMAAARSRVGINNAAEMITITSIPVSLYALLQLSYPRLFMYFPGVDGIFELGGRSVSTQGGPVYLGSLLAIATICSVYTARRAERPLIPWLASGLCIAGIIASQTRGAMLAAAVGLLVLIPNRRARCIAVLATMIPLALSPRLISKSADMMRLELSEIAFKTWWENPIVGCGPGNFFLAFRGYVTDYFVQLARFTRTAQSHAHNDLLHTAATMGLCGFIAYLILLIAVFKICNHARGPKRLFLLAVFAAAFVVAKVNPVSNGTIILLAVIFGIASARRVKTYSTRPMLAFSACVLCVLICQLCMAGYFFANGILAFHREEGPVEMALNFERAANLNPWEIQFAIRRIDSLGAMLNYTQPGVRKDIGKAMVVYSAEQIRRHPADSYSHEVYGKALIVSAFLGNGDNLVDAARAFENAQILAPTYQPLMIRREALGKIMGNTAIVKRAQYGMARMDKLTLGI